MEKKQSDPSSLSLRMNENDFVISFFLSFLIRLIIEKEIHEFFQSKNK